ncbi:MAG: ROK family protein [Solirubrobacterales bacterium]|nr:ROK family protein [Solirubrobacterales bacterium]
MAHHSPEPQTPAERLTAQQRKDFLKERRANSKRQRAADKAQRKAEKKAAKAARKAARKGGPEGGPLDLDPYAPITPERPADSPPGSPGASIAAAATEPPVDPPKPDKAEHPPVQLPPIHPPGTPSRRTAALIGGIDLGGTKIAAAVLDPDHKVIAYRRRPTPDRGGPADVMRAMAATIQEAALDAGTEAHRLLAVGVGSPGSVDPETGEVSAADNLPDWSGRFRLAQALSEEIGTGVKVGNDVQVGTRAEFELGAGAPYSSLLGVFWGTGVGGGIILDGQPWLGRGRAGEIGHTLVRRGGAKGLNGLNGTVEAYAGRKAMEEKALREVKKGRKTKLFKLMKKHDKTHLTSAIWQRALDDGDELAEDLLNRAVGALSAGIASAVNLLDVEAVVIGGGLGVRFADTLVPQIIDGMDRYLLNKDNPPAIKVAALGDEGGVIGASLLVGDAFEANQAPSA